jgi:hypothetical protein
LRDYLESTKARGIPITMCLKGNFSDDIIGHTIVPVDDLLVASSELRRKTTYFMFPSPLLIRKYSNEME